MSTIINSLKSTNGYRHFRNFGRNLRKTTKRLLLRRKLNKATPIFVFQMGKVASSSVQQSLEKQYPGAVVSDHHINSHRWRTELLHNWAESGNKLKLISPIREPIGRNISAFFEWFRDSSGMELKQSEHTTDELIQLFLENYPHDRPLTWFDDHIKKYFNIDVYKTPFPQSGIAEYSSKNIKLLVFKIDISDSEKEAAIRKFTGLPSFKLNNANVSDKKEYQDMYKDFIKSFSAPESYIEKFEKSKYFNHFYSKDEINRVISRWK